MRQLSRPARRGFLIAHLVVALGWLGLTLCLLALAVTGATTGSPRTAEAAYRSMKILGDWLLPPLVLLTLLTGLICALGTPWGLARHRWVHTKFWLTLAAAAAALLALRSGIDEAAAAAGRGQAVPGPGDLIVPPGMGLALYVFLTAISVLKPWGLTRRGRRQRERARASRNAKSTRGAGRVSATLGG